jgi:predicted Fe-Mo cluster-binding NifX family protein
MRIAVSSTGDSLESEASSLFGRCPYYLLVETDSMDFEAVPNPAVNASGGAGVKASQFIVEKNIAAVLTGRVGPNAMKVFRQSGTLLYETQGGTVAEEVQKYLGGELNQLSAPGESHAGMGGQSVHRKHMDEPQRSSRIQALTERARALRAELAALMDEIDRLEAEG